MKIKQYGPRMEELKREGKTNREIATDVGLKYEQVNNYFKRTRRKQRKQSKRGFPRSRKDDALKTNRELRSELKSLRMEVELLRDFLDAIERK